MTPLIRTRRLSDTIYHLFDGHVTPAAKREFLAAGAHDAVHEHHRAISFLVAEGLHGSAFCLLRPMFDGCIRGLWLLHIAGVGEMDRFVEGKYDPKPSQVLKGVEKRELAGAEALRRVYDEGWIAMSSYVHGGYQQIVGRLGVGFVGSNYSEEDVGALLEQANWFALLAAIELAEISANQSLVEAVIEVGHRYSDGQI